MADLVLGLALSQPHLCRRIPVSPSSRPQLSRPTEVLFNPSSTVQRGRPGIKTGSGLGVGVPGSPGTCREKPGPRHGATPLAPTFSSQRLEETLKPWPAARTSDSSTCRGSSCGLCSTRDRVRDAPTRTSPKQRKGTVQKWLSKSTGGDAPAAAGSPCGRRPLSSGLEAACHVAMAQARTRPSGTLCPGPAAFPEAWDRDKSQSTSGSQTLSSLPLWLGSNISPPPIGSSQNHLAGAPMVSKSGCCVT